MTARAGESGEGGHKPSTGETQAESNTIAAKAIRTAMPWLLDRTVTSHALTSISDGLKSLSGDHQYL